MYIIDKHIYKELKAEDILEKYKITKATRIEIIKNYVHQFIIELDDLYYYSIKDLEECEYILTKEIINILTN